MTILTKPEAEAISACLAILTPHGILLRCNLPGGRAMRQNQNGYILIERHRALKPQEIWSSCNNFKEGHGLQVT